LIQKAHGGAQYRGKPLVDVKTADKMAIVIQEILQDKIFLDASASCKPAAPAPAMPPRRAMLTDVPIPAAAETIKRGRMEIGNCTTPARPRSLRAASEKKAVPCPTRSETPPPNAFVAGPHRPTRRHRGRVLKHADCVSSRSRGSDPPGFVAGCAFALLMLARRRLRCCRARPFFFAWILVVPAAGAVLSLVARGQIRGSEGTQAGERLASGGVSP